MGKMSADGNLVNAGKCDPKGANLNRWNPDNTNDNLGVFLVRNFFSHGSRSLLKSRLLRSNFLY